MNVKLQIGNEKEVIEVQDSALQVNTEQRKVRTLSAIQVAGVNFVFDPIFKRGASSSSKNETSVRKTSAVGIGFVDSCS